MIDEARHIVRVDGGKYTFVCRGPVVEVLRYGEPWHRQADATNALTSMMAELDAARVVVQAARDMGDEAPMEIKDALTKHGALVSDLEPPSWWTK